MSPREGECNLNGTEGRNNCEHSGTCTKTAHSIVCRCPPQWGGAYCKVLNCGDLNFLWVSWLHYIVISGLCRSRQSLFQQVSKHGSVFSWFSDRTAAVSLSRRLAWRTVWQAGSLLEILSSKQRCLQIDADGRTGMLVKYLFVSHFTVTIPPYLS